MKKFLIFAAILMALTLVFVACKDPEQPENPADSTVESTPETPTTDPGSDDPTTDEPTTEDPGTTDPGTTEPGTTEPDPDPDPVKVVAGKSWDSLTKVPSEEAVFASGTEYMTWEQNAVAEVGMNDFALHVWGWVAFFAETEGTVGYSINGGDVVYNASFTYTAEVGVQDHIAAGNVPGAKSACRMLFDIPTADLPAGDHTVALYAKDLAGNEELIKEFTVTKTLPFTERGNASWSFDTVYLNDQMYFAEDGNAAGKLAAQNNTIKIAYGQEHTSMKQRGWIGFDQPISAFGYYITGVTDLVFDDSFYNEVPAGDPVKGAGGEHAQRFEITIPLDTLTYGTYRVGILVKLADESVVRMYETIVEIPPEALEDQTVVLGERDPAGTPFSGSPDMKFGQKLPLGGTFLKQVTIKDLATYSDGNTNTWSFKVWAWNTDYATTVAATPLYEITGENHKDNQTLVVDIPIDLLITGDVYYELEYLSGSGCFTGWPAQAVLVPGVETYVNGVPKQGTYASSVVIATLVEPDAPVVPEAPAETFTPETFAQPTIEEVKAGYTYDIGAGQFFQTITGKCTYVDLTTLNAGFQSFLQSAGFGQYAYYADDHISIAPPMTGEKLIVTMKVYDLQGNLGTAPDAFLLLNMTGGAQNSAQCNPVIEADPELPGVYTITFTEIVPGNTDELKFYMTQTCKIYIASVNVRIYIPSEDPNFTNLNFDSDVNSNFADDQNNKDPKVSDLANLFDQIIYAAGDPMFVTYNGGNPYYHVAGFSALHTRPVGNYAFTVNVVGTEGAEGFAGLFVRGYQNATNEKSFFGSDGNDNGSSYGGSGIYVNYLRRGVDYVVRINIKTYADGVYTPHIYYVPVESSEITFVDDGSVVTILAGGKKVATVEIIGTKDYGMEGVAADALSEKVILTLADGTVEELIDAVVATSVPASDLGIGTRTGVINFNRVSLKPADSVEIPADFYLPAEKVNVAQGKPVSSDSVENDTNIASNATDGNEGTRWGAEPNGVANLIVDLEAVYALDEILGYFENASWQYEVAISVDGNAYDVIYQGNPHGSIVVSVPVNADARFIKFTRLDDSANADPHWFSLYEVYAFGTLKDAAE